MVVVSEACRHRFMGPDREVVEITTQEPSKCINVLHAIQMQFSDLGIHLTTSKGITIPPFL